jgi:Cupin
VDLLYDHLMRARATGAVFARTVVVPPWGLRLGGSIQLALHAVTRGRAWLWFDDPGSAVELMPGEITLVRGGPAHHIAHDPGAECLEPDEFRRQHAPGTPNAEHPATVFLCGAYQFSGDVGIALLDSLPPMLTLSSTIDQPLREVIALLSRELTIIEPGQQTVLDRLLDVLLVLALRSDFRRSDTAPKWYRASADPRLRAALQAMHEDAGYPWSVPELAGISGLSRAAFAGFPPHARPSPAAVPHGLANDPRPRPPTRQRTESREHRLRSRIQLAIRLRGRLPPPPRHPARRMATTAPTKALVLNSFGDSTA